VEKAVEKRRRIPEWVDDPATPEDDLRSAMEGILRVNAALAYPQWMAWLATLELRRSPRRILDVGTGLADIPLAFARAARRRGERASAIGIDLNSRTAERARAYLADWPEVQVHAIDLFELPAQWEPFDVVTCHRTLHHLEDEQVVPFLQAMDAALVPGGILQVGDLVRVPVNEWAVWLGLTALGTSHITVRDGVASIRNSFVEPEALAFSKAAGLEYLRPAPLKPPCHWLLTGRKP